MKIPCTINKLAPGIDTRGTGGYIAAPPSIHPNGSAYEWLEGEIVDAPEWLVKLIMGLKKELPKPEPGVGTEVVEGDWTTEDVLSMLAVISPDDRDTWVQVGMALHSSGWPATMWDTWSRNSTKYKMGEPFRIWGGFKKGAGVSIGSLVYMAQANGWVPKDKPYEQLDMSNVGGVDLSEFKASLSPEIEEKIVVSGLIGDTVSWINETAQKRQPELALINTIAALGAIFGRRYALQKFNTRTNVYMVGIAETSQGKNHSRQKIKELMRSSGLDFFLGPDKIESGPGLMLELQKRPSLIMHIDEIGDFLENIKNQKAPVYLKAIVSNLLTIYSDSGSTVECGLLASRPDQRTILHEPNLCIYGTTVLAKYAEAMKSESVKSGELNRFIVLKPKIDFPVDQEKFDKLAPPPESLISRWGRFKVEGLQAAPEFIEQEKVIVLLGDTAEEIKKIYLQQDENIKKHHKNGLGALWGRYGENVLKIAMISAICRDSEKPKLINTDLVFGRAIVGASLKFMFKFATTNMYDSAFQQSCSLFMERIEEGINNRTDMLRYMRIKAKELDEIERALFEMGKITFTEKDRPRRYLLTNN